MTHDDLIEALAAIEHERWADWQKYLHSKCSMPLVGSGLLIPMGYVDALERQIATPYVDLSEEEKASDRREVERYWPLIVEFVAEWMSNWYGQDPRTEKPYAMRMPEDWREEMGT